MYGQGNIAYNGPPTTAADIPGLILGADNGLSISSIDSTLVVLGQDVGETGSPGQLISDREIPMNQKSLKLSGPGDGYGLFSGLTFAADPGFLQIYRGTADKVPIEFVTIQGKAPAPGAPYGNYWYTMDESFTNPDGQIDAVMQIGYNQNGGGGPVNPDEAEFHIAFESHFQPGGIGTGQFEWHLQSAAKNGDVNRALSFDIQKANGQTFCFMQTDGMDWLGTKQSGVSTNAYMSISNLGTLALSGSASQFTIGNTGAGYGALQVAPASDGSISYNVSGGGASPVHNFSGSINISPTTSEALTIQATNNAIGIQFDSNSTGAYQAIHTNGAYPGGLSAAFVNGSNGAGAFSLLLLETNMGGSTAIPGIYFLDATAGAGFLIGEDPGHVFRTAYNPFGFFSSGVLTSLTSTGQFGVGVNSPTAHVHTGPGTAAPGDGGLKISTDTGLKTIPENGLFEFFGGVLFFTTGGVRKTVTLV